ncbi:MAG: response regulator [Nitrospira sp.]|nr:response regulator [Nitrospira sp.]
MIEGRSVIIVDDNLTLLDVLKNGLSSEGYHCETATSAASALELINNTLFDIMITDIVIGDMNGFELTKKAKRLNPDMIVIIMTGFIDEFSYDQAIEAGASDFMKKPFSLKELFMRIRHVKMQENLLKREEELKKKVKELEEFYNMAIGRELKMIELKKEIERLKNELGKYKKP